MDNAAVVAARVKAASESMKKKGAPLVEPDEQPKKSDQDKVDEEKSNEVDSSCRFINNFDQQLLHGFTKKKGQAISNITLDDCLGNCMQSHSPPSNSSSVILSKQIKINGGIKVHIQFCSHHN